MLICGRKSKRTTAASGTALHWLTIAGSYWLRTTGKHHLTEKSAMSLLKVSCQILIVFVMLHCVASVPQNRFLLSSSEQADDLHSDGWLTNDLSANPFLRITRSRPSRNLSALNSHHLEKRRCNTATCVTQRLADFLIRSSNTIGTVYVPTNVGANTYGKRDLQHPPVYLPF